MAYDTLQRAIKKAFTDASLRSDGNMNMDADVKFYENLKPEAFDVIAATYGPENLAAYVQAMEVKRMKGARNGNSIR